MATTISRVFVDTNVLVYSNIADSPFHETAKARLEDLDSSGSELWISRQTLREYLAAMTKPGILTGTIPIASLVNDVKYFGERFDVAEDGPGVTEKLLELLQQVQVAGRQIHDANIVATMLINQVPVLLTHNVQDFKRFAHLIQIEALVPAGT